MSDWISVTDRLPEKETTVWVCTKENEQIGAWLEDTGWTANDLNEEYWLSGVTHWMPLPAPPKEKE